jgi:phthalate 4,5-cis-dihydrodiol dehydrogenase
MMVMQTKQALKIAICGLGRAFVLTLPSLLKFSGIAIVGGIDPQEDTRKQFTKTLSQPGFSTLEELHQSIDYDAVYIASPHQFHLEHVSFFLKKRKIVLCEKPMSISVADALEMVRLSDEFDTPLLIGPSHSYDESILQTARMIHQGTFGQVRMIQMLNYTDFLYRPRRTEELDSSQGGGVVYSQAAHHLDIARLLGGSYVKTITAQTGNWDPARSTEGAYSAQLKFANDCFASLTYSGYGLYDSDELCGNFSELGFHKNELMTGKAKKSLETSLATGLSEGDLKRKNSNLKMTQKIQLPDTHEHFGMILVSCDSADLKIMPDRIMIYETQGIREITLAKPTIPRENVFKELLHIWQGQAALHDANWGLSTMELIFGLLESAKTQSIYVTQHQSLMRLEALLKD